MSEVEESEPTPLTQDEKLWAFRKATNSMEGGNSNIKLQFSYTAGSYTGEDANYQPQVTGLQSDALNVVVSTATPNGHNVSGVLGGAEESPASGLQ